MNARTYRTSSRAFTTPRSNIPARLQWFGWNDFRDGQGFRSDYDDNFSSVDQVFYEDGRRCAAAVVGALGYIPEWPEHRALVPILRRHLLTSSAFALYQIEHALTAKDGEPAPARRIRQGVLL